tara:strand:+ start:257 stop:484 length:228 start_codon:yes stop_codon:yes gene_type:complete
MTEELRTKSRFPSGKLSRYRVGLVIEFYKDQFVKAIDEVEAKEIAENRLRRRRGLWKSLGFSIGDIEIVDAEKED